MLFHTPELQQSLSSGQDCEDQVKELVDSLNLLQADPVEMEEGNYIALHGIVASARRLAAQLRCQRGCVYEVDTSIAVGDYYDNTKMTDIQFIDDDDGDGDDAAKEPPVVTSVIANAIVRRRAPGSSEVDDYLSKAHVIVSMPE